MPGVLTLFTPFLVPFLVLAPSSSQQGPWLSENLGGGGAMPSVAWKGTAAGPDEGRGWGWWALVPAVGAGPLLSGRDFSASWKLSQ